MYHRRVHGPLYRHACVYVCICMDMWLGIHIDVGADMRIEVHVGMCIDLRIDMCVQDPKVVASLRRDSRGFEVSSQLFDRTK